MILTNPDIHTSLLDIKKMKYFNTQMNLKVENEYFTQEFEPLTNSYRYQCATHINYIFNYPHYSVRIYFHIMSPNPKKLKYTIIGIE